MDNAIESLLSAMWTDYLQLAPDAGGIYKLFAADNDGEVINDHIALRTFNLPKVNLNVIASVFLDNGYVEGGEYQFPARKLYARHFQHPDPTLPKVFISELLVEQLSEPTQAIINDLVSQITPEQLANPYFCCSGRPWSISIEQYEQLLGESEYAAWVAAFGYRANHFTVSINHLNSLDDIHQLNSKLQKHGYILNATGGLIKGSPDVLLEQSSTLAKAVEVEFSNGKKAIPGCFYEFAKRYPTSDGSLYQGFVAASADKIFTSTHTRAE